MGVPYFKIKDTVQKHGITVFSSHFSLYRDISRRVFSVMRAELDLIEQYSIDEAFFRVDVEPSAVASRLKYEVERSVGIPVSVGIAPTKTLAKVANGRAKKGTGIHVLDRSSWFKEVQAIPLAQIWGVGGKLEFRYKQHGIQTVADLLTVDSARLVKLFGSNGVRLQQELSGTSVLLLQQKHQPQHSIMSSRSFQNVVTDRSTLADAVAYHVRHTAADLRAEAQVTSHIRIAIYPSRYGDFVLRGGTREAILPIPTNNTLTLLQVAETLLDELFEAGVPYKKVGVTLLELTPVAGVNLKLFGAVGSSDDGRLMLVVDALNRRGGKEVVLFGSHLKNTAWQAKAEVRSPAYTTRWSDIAVVKTDSV